MNTRPGAATPYFVAPVARVELRDLANKGMVPGVTKSSW